MNIMHYKGYSAPIEYSDEDQCLVGRLAGIDDLIGFHADSVTELRKEFEEAVDDYLEACQKLNRKPQRPYSGKLMLRIDPGLHAKAAARAEAESKSLNAWAQEALQRAIS